MSTGEFDATLELLKTFRTSESKPTDLTSAMTPALSISGQESHLFEIVIVCINMYRVFTVKYPLLLKTFKSFQNAVKI